MTKMKAEHVHLEVERKYDVDQAFTLPELTLEGLTTRKLRVQRLAATYFDTPDLRLQAAKVTLRRRTGGTDAGWHLKLPVAGDRLELQRPLGRGAVVVPADLAGLVRLYVREASLGPVAKIQTRRAVTEVLDADGTVLAEIADDVVNTEALGGTVTLDSWREFEIELVRGDLGLLERLGEVLTAAGARPSASASKVGRVLGAAGPAPVPSADVVATGPAPKKAKKKAKAPVLTAGDVVTAYVREQVQEVLLRDPQVRLDLEDAVHKMRVATRRLRSTFTTFGLLFDDDATAPLSADLKWLADVLGRVRDAEVLRGLLLGWVAALPEDLVLGPVHNRIDIDLRAEHGRAHEALVAELDGERYLALVVALEGFASAPALTEAAANPAGPELHVAVDKAVKKVGKRVEAAIVATDGEERDLHLHETRKAVKKLRYGSEAVEPVFGKDAKKARKALTTLQEALGGHQDAVVARQTLRDIGVRAHLSGENGFTFGLLHGLHTPTENAEAVDVEVLSDDVAALRKAWSKLG